MTGMVLKHRVQELAKQHGSLRAAARAVGVDHVYLWRLAQGHKCVPSDAVLRKLGLRRVVWFELIPPKGTS
jgi:molybdenum-dependent DNA-binding transcriptional regulator ModE